MNDNSFRLYTSNNLNTLAELYSRHRNNAPMHFRVKGFFTREKICVATRGMGTWLHQWLVKKGHVIANVEFPFLRDAIDDIIKRFMQTQSDARLYHPELFMEEVLIWRIYRQLDIECLNDELKILKDYLILSTDGNARAVRRYQLARKLAQLYYEYMAFVPEKLVFSERANIPKSSRWQIVLWKKLCKDNDGNAIISPAEAMLRFLQNDTTLQADAFEPATFFGVSAMAPYFLLVLKKLSTVQPVNFFYLNHCADLWDDTKANWEHRQPEPDGFDDHFNNTLLCNFGTQGREFFKAILDLDGIDENDHFDYDHEWENSKSSCRADAGMTLLKNIQARILSNVDETTEEAQTNLTDDSLTIHSCFNELREVEALHDCILHLLKKYDSGREKLTMNDIIVMAPDIAKFAPAIQAVFDRGPLHAHYCISDRSVKGANLLADAFLNVMEIPKSRFEVTRISNLLDSTHLRARFGFTDDGISRLREWLIKAGIHWGRDAKDRKSVGDFEEFSWRHGLDNLLAKLAFDANGETAQQHFPDDIVPINFSTGNENLSLLNGLLKFYGELNNFSATVENSSHAGTPKSGPQWCDFLMEERDRFFLAESDSTLEYSQLGKTFTDMKNAMLLAGYSNNTKESEFPPAQDIIPYDVVFSALSSAMDSPAKGEPFLNGKITFCSLLPMRGIPCKIIALIGMDAGEFPRPNDTTGFNLVNRKDSNGKELSGNLLKYYDRSRSIEDRFTFLEALMSAKNHLMIFYKGQNDENLKEDLVPAAPVVELREYIKKIRPDSMTPIVKHRLNPFDPKTFSSAPEKQKTLCDAFSFDKEMAQIANAIVKQQQTEFKLPKWLEAYSLPLPNSFPVHWNNDEITIPLDEMVKFFKDPSSRYAATRLDLPPNRWESEPLSDFEPFNMNPRNAAALKNALTAEQTTNGKEFDSDLQNSTAQKLAVSQSLLPSGTLGEIEFASQRINSWVMNDEFREELCQQENSQAENFEIDLGQITPALNDKLKACICSYANECIASANANEEFKLVLPEFSSKHVKITGTFKYFHESNDKPQGIRTRINANVNGKHLIPIILEHLILAASNGKDTVSRYNNASKAKKTKERTEETAKLSTLSFSGNAGTDIPAENTAEDSANVQTPKCMLRTMAALYLFGHFYPLPLFGKASPQHSADLTNDMQENDNAAHLFSDFAENTSLSENATNLLKSFADECYPLFESENKSKNDK